MTPGNLFKRSAPRGDDDGGSPGDYAGLDAFGRHRVLPAVPADQNGSGTTDTRIERFDPYGYPTWTQDARGFLTRSEHDVATGALVQRIDDVDTSQVSDALSG